MPVAARHTAALGKPKARALVLPLDLFQTNPQHHGHREFTHEGLSFKGTKATTPIVPQDIRAAHTHVAVRNQRAGKR